MNIIQTIDIYTNEPLYIKEYQTETIDKLTRIRLHLTKMSDNNFTFSYDIFGKNISNVDVNNTGISCPKEITDPTAPLKTIINNISISNISNISCPDGYDIIRKNKLSIIRNNCL